MKINIWKSQFWFFFRNTCITCVSILVTSLLIKTITTFITMPWKIWTHRLAITLIALEKCIIMYDLLILDNGDLTHTFQSLLFCNSQPPRWPSILISYMNTLEPPHLLWIRSGPGHPAEYGGSYNMWFVRLGQERDFSFYFRPLNHLLWGKL